MKEMILRITSRSKDIEIIYSDSIREEIIEKNLSIESLIGVLNEFRPNSNTNTCKCSFLDPSIIAFGQKGNIKKYVINQPEQVRFITYSVSDTNSAYKINFPNSIYCVTTVADRITRIEAFMYLKYNGISTELYEYAMPNMLTGNAICIGNANTQIEEGNLIQTLENIIYAPYSHANVNNIKGFKETQKYFEFLQKNCIKEKYLKKTKKIIKDLLEE